MKQILFLGDGASRGFSAELTAAFEGLSLIRGGEASEATAREMRKSLDTLMADCKKPDAVFWNTGRFDALAEIDNEAYLEEHARLGGSFKKATAQVVFATTLPFHHGHPRAKALNERIASYNEAAKEMFASMEGYRVCDLAALVCEDTDRYLTADSSLTEEGKALCTKAVYDILFPFVEKPNVVLFGDSLRQNYENAVQGLMWEDAKVAFPPDNSRFAAYQLFTLNEMRHQLPRNVDVVHFNAGAWDRNIMPYETDTFTSREEYLRNLTRLCNAYRYYYGDDVILIFALTTPNAVRSDWPALQAWNEAAAEAMKEQGCIINDLFTPIVADADRYLGPDGVHLSDEGIAMVAEQVAATVRQALADDKKKFQA